MAKPKTIKIFLIDGEPNGLKTAELSNWIGQAIVIPRNRLKEIRKRLEWNRPAVYFLLGKETEESILPTAYIGEAENLLSRLLEHEGTKDFWQIATAFISKDNALSKAHVKWLESKCVSVAQQVKRYALTNSSSPSAPNLSESDVADMEEFLTNLKLLLSSLGYPILKDIISVETSDKENPIFYCTGKGAEAMGRLTDEGFIIYKDSTASKKPSEAVAKKNERTFEKLLKDGYIEEQSDDLYKFIKDYICNSPSMASDLILGNSTNGWDKWKTKEGKILNDIYRTIPKQEN